MLTLRKCFMIPPASFMASLTVAIITWFVAFRKQNLLPLTAGILGAIVGSAAAKVFYQLRAKTGPASM